MKKIVLNEQEFTTLREQDGVYVDKTRQIFEMIDYSRYIFLSRPRRFGKSLLVSTLKALFLGQKEYFKGLWIEDKWEWETYPVIRLDFSTLLAGGDTTTLNNSLNAIFKKHSEQYDLDIEIDGVAPPTVFQSLLFKLHRKTGKKIVVLIDEYDHPVTSHISSVEKAERNREYLRNIFIAIKSNSAIIQFTLMTGITKFAKMSIFSAISQLKDISLLPKFNDIVGFTEDELIRNFTPQIKAFGEANQTDWEKTLENITLWYDGYSWDGKQHIFNPYAILNALTDQRLDTYWFETGTPTFLIKLITQSPPFINVDAPLLQQLDDLPASKRNFDSHDLRNIDITAALFQSGYLTIKKVLRLGRLESYILGFPNYEVRHAFNAHLLQTITKKDIAIVKKSLLTGRTITLMLVCNLMIV